MNLQNIVGSMLGRPPTRLLRQPMVFDWGSVILSVAFILVIPLPLFSVGILNWIVDHTFPNAEDIYQRAVGDAAVRHASDERELRTVDLTKPTIEVGTF